MYFNLIFIQNVFTNFISEIIYNSNFLFKKRFLFEKKDLDIFTILLKETL